MDNWDPRVVDGLAARRRVIAFDNRGVGGSSGSTPDTIEVMARDAVLFIRALGFDQVDLLGLSMGGFIAQVIAEQEPHLIRKVILAGTGPAGGTGIDKVPALTLQATLKGALTRQDPKLSLFFTETEGGRRAGRAFLERLKERTHHRDKGRISKHCRRLDTTALKSEAEGLAEVSRLPPALGRATATS
ncbi:alpha/beta hydrolase [Streptomyces sp. HP-A2021]|nr:alpha/beta hydrolase [Streptomyces sp. HP-A2021]